MLIIWSFLRLQFFPLKIILFFHKYRETIFCDIISVKKPAIIEIMSFGQSHGQTPLENVLFMALFKTWIFFALKIILFFPQYQKRCFLIEFLWKKQIRKIRFLDKIHGLTPLENVHFLPFFKTSFFFYLKSFFSFYNIKNDLFWYDFCEKRR